MKSIIQEASSIAKAIEQGLIKAGNPRDFAIKILEYPEKNFFGMTTKPAKIALYCDDRIRKPHEPYSAQSAERAERGERTERPRDRQGRNEPRRDSREGRDHRSFSHENPRHETSRSDEPRRERHSQQRIQQRTLPEETSSTEQRKDEEPITSRWSAETVKHTKDWLTQVLVEMHRLVPFSVEIDNLCLRITLERRLFEDAEHERRVLASLSLLLIETSKHAFKLNLRGHKVLLTHKS